MAFLHRRCSILVSILFLAHANLIMQVLVQVHLRTPIFPSPGNYQVRSRIMLIGFQQQVEVGRDARRVRICGSVGPVIQAGEMRIATNTFLGPPSAPAEVIETMLVSPTREDGVTIGTNTSAKRPDKIGCARRTQIEKKQYCLLQGI